MAKLTAAPAAQTLGQSVALGYTGAEYGGQLRITRPGGSKYYISITSVNGSKSYKPTATGSYRADLLNRRGSVLSTAAFGIVPVVVVPPPPPPSPLPVGAVKLADEPLQGQPLATFVQPADGLVWYGANSKFATKQFAKGATVTCSNATFGGDPIPNVLKACWVAPFVVTPPPPPPPPPIFKPVLSGKAGVESVTLSWTDG